MSCYHPITIANPALVKNNVFNKTTITVPCGHCHSCKETKKLGWFVRLYYEWRYCEDNNGFALFETLTYNQEHLPHFLRQYFPHTKLYPCFSTRDIQLYLKRLRKALSKLYSPELVRGHVKYFLSMELGSRTLRPHYHVVFFVSTPLIGRHVFQHVCEILWHDKGFTKRGSLNNGFICSQGGLNYCAKYVCKDITEEEYYREVLNKLYKAGFTHEELKDGLPHNMQSKNLGIYALEMDKHNDLDNFLNGNINIPDNKHGILSYKLPLYYERKIFYNVHYRYFDNTDNCYKSVSTLSALPRGVDYSPIYVLNDLGLEMKDKRAKKALDACSNVYRVVQSIPDIEHIRQKLNHKFNKHYESIKDFQKDIKKQLPEEDFVSYSLVYRGSVVPYNVGGVALPADNAFYDYRLIHKMSTGFRPLSIDFNGLCENILASNSIPFIEDNYQMIRYVYFLIHLELEEIFIQRERDYCENKTVHLLQTECVT